MKNVSPKWGFDDATYDRTAAPFNNPDRVAIVIHNYHWRLSLAKGEYAKKFSGKYSHRILNGIDHNMPEEDPQPLHRLSSKSTLISNDRR